MAKKIFISAGDPSGDVHAAKLMHEIKNIAPDINFIGIGGNKMQAQGLQSIIPLEQISIVGFWEVLKNASMFRKLINDTKEILKYEKPDVFIPVDYPGFNIKIAAFAKSINIPVYYYIAPQLWAWGKNRAAKLAGNVDQLFVVFPFEEKYFSDFGINTRFVGHPLLDIPKLSAIPPELADRENLIAILPGSRLQEVKKHLPLLNSTINTLRPRVSGYKFGIACSGNISKDYYYSALDKNNDIELYDDSLGLMLKSKVGIVKTGTSNLEAALCGMPFSMFYLASLISYIIGKSLMNIEHVSLVNILLKKGIINEFIQKDANATNISNDILNILNDNNRYNEIISAFSDIKNILGEGGASKLSSKIIMKQIYGIN